MDTIVINELEAHARIGVPDSERGKPQRLLISVELRSSFGEAAATDDLSKTIDYDRFCRDLRAHLAVGQWKLLETLAEQIANKAISDFGANSAVVEIKKFVIPRTKWVGVRIERLMSEHST